MSITIPFEFMLHQNTGFAEERPAYADDFMTLLQRLPLSECPLMKLELVVPDQQAEAVVAAITGAGRTGEVGDGKIFLSRIDDAVRIRTGERGEAAL